MFGIQGLGITGGIETARATHLDRNAFVTSFVPDVGRATTEMTPVKAALLSLAMLAAIMLWGVGIYGADASSGHAAVDGYGVTTALNR
jgi:hypothetical protein